MRRTTGPTSVATVFFNERCLPITPKANTLLAIKFNRVRGVVVTNGGYATCHA